jgi:nicotinamidase/pyrazinamidase
MPAYDERTALVVVDVQNDFADPRGSLSVPDGLAVVPVINAQVHAARAAGAFVAYSQDWHPASTPHFVKDGGVWPVHCVADTWGAKLVEGLVVDGPVVRKGVGGEDGYSAFGVRDPESGDESATDLDRLLRARGVERLVIAGIATDYCVKATALDAARLGFATSVVRDGIRAVDLEPGDGEQSVAEMVAAGVALS